MDVYELLIIVLLGRLLDYTALRIFLLATEVIEREKEKAQRREVAEDLERVYGKKIEIGHPQFVRRVSNKVREWLEQLEQSQKLPDRTLLSRKERVKFQKYVSNLKKKSRPTYEYLKTKVPTLFRLYTYTDGVKE